MNNSYISFGLFIGLFLTLLLLPSTSAFYLSIKSYDNAEGDKQIRIIVDDNYPEYLEKDYFGRDYYNYRPKKIYKREYSKYTPEYTREIIYKILDNLESAQISYINEKDLYANRLLKQPVKKYKYSKEKGYRKSKY